MHNRPSSSAGGTAHFQLLDGYRGLAAVAVVLFHMRTTIGGVAPSSAYLAVDLFFALSGYVISYAYDSRKLATWHFALLRVVRLFPLYLAGSALTAVAAFAAVFVQHDAHYWSASQLLQTVALALFMLPSVATGNLFQFNMPAWSLFYEMIASLVYGARGWLRIAPATCMAVCGAGLAIEAVRHGGLDHGAVWEWSRGETLAFGICRVGFSFPLGMLMRRHADSIRLPTIPAPILLVALGAVLCAWPSGSLRVVYDLLFVAILSPVLILLGSRASGQARWGYGFLGEISYPIYVLHNPVLDLVTGLLRRHNHAGFIPPWAQVAFLAGLIIVAWAAGAIDASFRSWLTTTLGIRARKRPAMVEA